MTQKVIQFIRLDFGKQVTQSESDCLHPSISKTPKHLTEVVSSFLRAKMFPQLHSRAWLTVHGHVPVSHEKQDSGNYFVIQRQTKLQSFLYEEHGRPLIDYPDRSLGKRDSRHKAQSPFSRHSIKPRHCSGRIRVYLFLHSDGFDQPPKEHAAITLEGVVGNAKQRTFKLHLCKKKKKKAQI